jgi:hypothetical protein
LAFSAFAPPGFKPDTLIAALGIIVGALAYRSCKKRKLGEVPNTTVRLAVELWGVLLIVFATCHHLHYPRLGASGLRYCFIEKINSFYTRKAMTYKFYWRFQH